MFKTLTFAGVTRTRGLLSEGCGADRPIAFDTAGVVAPAPARARGVDVERLLPADMTLAHAIRHRVVAVAVTPIRKASR